MNEKNSHQEMTTTLVVMTLNEVEGCRKIMPQIKPEWCQQILFIDGGSTDGTIEWAEENGYQLYRQKRTGIRQGYKEAWHLIEGDMVITFSPDGNCIAEKIPELIAKMKEGYDMVIGSRYLGDATSDDDDVVTGWGNWFFTKTVNVLFGGGFTDVMVIFRAYRTDLVKRLDLENEKAFGWVDKIFFLPTGELSWEPLLTVKAQKHGCKIAEIPASEPARIGGVRKLKVIQWGGAIYFQFLREFFLSR
ncbi:MAG TPA: glycosyltransferase family 2 protein [Rhodospirillales bacterium]|nr:glycosyltransferase family 2 protein [Rhodospirillales bacterium]